MDKKINQQNRIIQYMREHNGITGIEATNKLHIMDYRKRISELRRKGDIIIADKWERGADGARYKRYFIEEARA